MKQIKIHIEKLGLIRNADLEIAPLMVFTGESGFGKSYLAILSHYFFFVWLSTKRINKLFVGKKSSGFDFFDVDAKLPDQGDAMRISKKELECWLASDAISYLGYMIGHDSVDASISVTLPDDIPSEITFHYETEMMGINNAEDIYYKLSVLSLTYRFRQLGIQDESPYAYLLRYAMLNELFGDFKNLDYSFVFPPSRGAYMSEEMRGNTGLYKSFILGMQQLEQMQELPDEVSANIIEMFHEVLNGSVKRKEGRYVYITHGAELPISASASSVRELAPFEQMVAKRDVGKTCILIEEPEAHLHPTKQRTMAEIIAALSLGGAHMQITTHSDFFMRRLNDLIRLHIIKSKKSDKEYREFCEENHLNGDLTLDPEKVTAYFLELTGEGEVRVVRQDTTIGIPFDTFESVNGEPLTVSSKLYDEVANEE